MLEWMQTTPARTVDDVAVLVDLALDIEFDAPSPDLLLQDRPWDPPPTPRTAQAGAGSRDLLAAQAIKPRCQLGSRNLRSGRGQD